MTVPPTGSAREGEHLGPGEQVASQRHDLASDLVLGAAAENGADQHLAAQAAGQLRQRWLRGLDVIGLLLEADEQRRAGQVRP